MFALLGLIFKVLFLLIGVFFVMAGINEWQWAMRMVLGKKTRQEMGETLSKVVFILIGVGLIIMTLFWIF